MQNEQRRKAKRVWCFIEARWEFPQAWWHDGKAKENGFVREIGAGGCLVQSKRKVPVGMAVKVEMQTPAGEWLSLVGVVKHFEKMGFGLRFARLDDSERESLIALLNELLAQIHSHKS